MGKITVYRRLPIAIGDNICPVCNNRIKEKKKISTEVISHAKGSDRFHIIRNKYIYKYEALYCRKCNIPIVGHNSSYKFHKLTGRFLDCFSCKGLNNINAIILKMDCYQYEEPTAASSKDSASVDYYTLVRPDYTQFKTPKNIIGIDAIIYNCLKCHGALTYDFTLIPYNDSFKAKVDGYCCRHCDTLFVIDGDFINALIANDNEKSILYTSMIDPKAKEDSVAYRNKMIQLRKQFYSGFSQNQQVIPKDRQSEATSRKPKNESTASQVTQHNSYTKQPTKADGIYQQPRTAKKTKLDIIPSSRALIYVKYSDNTLHEYIIVDKIIDANNDDVFHYASDEGLELLSAAFAVERKGEGVFNGKEYHVIQTRWPTVHQVDSIEHLIPRELNVKASGGMYRKDDSDDTELVDMLLYSLGRNRYEIIHATHDKLHNVFFTDMSLFKQYIKKHGRPSIKFNFVSKENDNYNGSFWDTLNHESLLKAFGYSVSKADGLSRLERQKILSDIIDLEIMTVSEVKNMLNFFASTRQNIKYQDAVNKWREDEYFVINYRVNPERFYIVNSF